MYTNGAARLDDKAVHYPIIEEEDHMYELPKEWQGDGHDPCH